MGPSKKQLPPCEWEVDARPRIFHSTSSVPPTSNRLARTETTEHLNRLRAEDLTWLQQSVHQHTPLSWLNPPEVPVPVILAPETDERHMWEDFDDHPGEFLLGVNGDPQTNPVERIEEAEFYRDLDRAQINLDPGISGFEEFYVESDDDGAFTRIIEDLNLNDGINQSKELRDRNHLGFPQDVRKPHPLHL